MTPAGEACLKFEDAETAIDMAFDSLTSHCVSYVRQDVDYAFEFQSVRALVWSNSGMLWQRGKADEITICDGIKMLFESEIRSYAKGMPTNVLWVLATGGGAFDTIMAYGQSEPATAC